MEPWPSGDALRDAQRRPASDGLDVDEVDAEEEPATTEASPAERSRKRKDTGCRVLLRRRNRLPH
jgi:hypothetical protein